MGIVRTEKGSIRLVMLMIDYASVERLRRRRSWSWICDTECNRNIQRLVVLDCCGGLVGLLVIEIDYWDIWPVVI